MVHPTFRTIPLPYIQRHFIYNVTTRAAAFRAWKPSVDLNQFSSVLLAFVGKLSYQLAPRSVANRLGEFMVFYQTFDCQILNYYRLVFTYQLSRQLMQKIFPTISYLPMYLSYFFSLFLSIVRPFLFAIQSFLNSSELRAQPLKVLGISDLVSIASSNQASYSYIQADRFIRLWQRNNRCIC